MVSNEEMNRWEPFFASGTITSLLITALRQERARIEQLRKVLNEIASWGEGDTVGSHFDEPGSAIAARQALANDEGK